MQVCLRGGRLHLRGGRLHLTCPTQNESATPPARGQGRGRFVLGLSARVTLEFNRTRVSLFDTAMDLAVTDVHEVVCVIGFDRLTGVAVVVCGGQLGRGDRLDAV